MAGSDENGMNRTQVASQMLHSGECTSARVRALYANICTGRPARRVSTFSQMLQQGNSDQVEATIVASPEYFNSRAAERAPAGLGFVSGLLGRPADPPAVAMFTQQLGASTSRAQVAQQVLGSNEARSAGSTLFTTATFTAPLQDRCPRKPGPGGGEHHRLRRVLPALKLTERRRPVFLTCAGFSSDARLSSFCSTPR
jgi:hypothetical protein